MGFSRSKSLAFLGAAFTATALLSSTAALAAGTSPSTTAAARSARLEAELSAKMAAQLRFNPSGRAISPNQVSYDHGKVVVTLSVPGATPDFTCPTGDICLFDEDNLTGDNAAINAPVGSPINIRAFLPIVASLHNLRDKGTVIQKKMKNSSPNAQCYVSGQRANSVSQPVASWGWLYLEKNDNC